MTESLTPLETAILFQVFLERFEWRFSLTDEGKLHVIIGDDPPTLSQQQVLAIIAAHESEFQALLAGGEVH